MRLDSRREVRALLRQYGLRPKKSLGQNFLVNQAALQRIVEAAEVGATDLVVEVGPGLGCLTRQLAQRSKWVVAVELDQRLVEILEQVLADYPNISIVHGDILEIPPAELLMCIGRPDTPTTAPYKLVANLPYYITSAVLRHFLEADSKPSTMVVTVQREVAQRLTAKPGEMSLLAVSVQFYGRPRIVARLSAGAFYPSPRVDSAVVRIDPYESPPMVVDDEEGFFAVVRAGFAQRRKQLRNALSQGLGLSTIQVVEALERAVVDPKCRAQSLTLAEWGKVYQELKR